MAVVNGAAAGADVASVDGLVGLPVGVLVVLGTTGGTGAGAAPSCAIAKVAVRASDAAKTLRSSMRALFAKKPWAFLETCGEGSA